MDSLPLLPQSQAVRLGERLREARRNLRISLRELGELTGFSASFLSQVELGQSSPSLGSLERICEALGLRLAELLAPADNAPVVRRSRRKGHRSDWSKATAESLVPAGADERLSAMLLTLEPGGRTGATRYGADVHLFAYCTSGTSTLVLRDPGEEVGLESGDSLMLDGPRSVAWENRNQALSELLVVISRSGADRKVR